jgi:nucleoid DNA-binding protein
MLIEKQIIEKIKQEKQILTPEIKKVIKSIFYGIRTAIEEDEEIYIKYLGTFKKKKNK